MIHFDQKTGKPFAILNGQRVDGKPNGKGGWSFTLYDGKPHGVYTVTAVGDKDVPTVLTKDSS